MLGFQNIKTILIKNTPNIGEKKFLLLVKLKVQFRGHTISDLNDEPIVRSFSEKELQKTNQKEFRTEKVIKTICDKLHVKWKGYDNSFSSWIDKKDL